MYSIKNIAPFITILAVYSIITAKNSIQIFLKRKKTNTFSLMYQGISRLPRFTTKQSVSLFTMQIIQLVVIVILIHSMNYKISDLGIKFNFFPLISFTLGIIVYIIVTIIYEFVSHLLKAYESLAIYNFNITQSLWPKNKQAKCYAFIGICLLNPITEEIIFRGIFIYLFGLLLNNFYIVIVFSVLLSLLCHLYQGPYNLVFHFFINILAIILLFSPFGLIASIGFHFGGDLYPLLTVRKSMEVWIKNRNKIRSSSCI